MTRKQITLAAAEFLDSEPARRILGRGDVPGAGLRHGGEAAVRKVVERLLSVCYAELGQEPRLLDGEGLRVAVGQRLAAHFALGDDSAEIAPHVVEAFFEHLFEAEVVPQAFELRHAMDDALAAFATALASAETPRHGGVKQETVVHRADKLGRNDPCFCGSGRKFKKCCGKDA